MKKKIIVLITIICAIALLGGCKTNSKETPNEKVKISNDYITIKKYVGLEVEKVEELKVTDEDVEKSIKYELDELGLVTYAEVTDRAAQLGDVATIDYVGKKDGVAFDGGTDNDFDLELGSKTFIDGFEDKVAGHKTGETFDINLTFPEDYGKEELNGADVVFTITIKKLQEKIYPELTVDIVKQIGSSAATVEEYRTQVRADLEQSNKETSEANLQNAVWDALLEQCTMKKYPDGMIDEYVASLQEQYYYYAYMSGMETDEFIEMAFEMTTEELAKKQITLQYAIDAVAETEKLTISDEDYSKGLAELAVQYGYDEPTKMEEDYGADTIRQSLLQDKVGKYLVENCVQVEPKK